MILLQYHLYMFHEDEPDTRYVSYLLRLQLMRKDDQSVWVASTESTTDGSHRSFPNVETLAAFLLAEFGERQLNRQGGTPDDSEDSRPPGNE